MEGGIQGRRDSGKEGFRKESMQERTRKEGKQDRADSRTRYSGKEGYRTENEPVRLHRLETDQSIVETWSAIFRLSNFFFRLLLSVFF